MRNRGVPIAFLAIAAAIAAAACNGAGGGPRSSPTAPPRASTAIVTAVTACKRPFPAGTPSAATVRCADPSAMRTGRVIRIVDGDTLHVELDGQDETVRLYGVNTPERGQPCFEEATTRLTDLAGTEVRLLPDRRERDRYGRLLRYVYTPDGLSIDAELVAEGFGRAWRDDGALRFAIIDLETLATTDRTGCLWR